VKVLTVRQPWAWAIFRAGKDIENRTWKTNYRGPLLIHAAGSLDRYGWDAMREVLGIEGPPEVAVGVILGRVDLVNILEGPRDAREFPSRWYHPSERPGTTSYAWVLANPVAFKDPLVIKGKLHLWEIPDHQAASLK
jgi:ASCH domain